MHRERIVAGVAVRVLLWRAARREVRRLGVSVALSEPLPALEILKTVPTLTQLCECGASNSH